MIRDYRVLLIAMSGVRVKDKELLKLGMTLPGFVERSEVIASLPSLSLLTLAAHCPQHWHPTYIEIDQLNLEKASIDIVNNYDLVAITTFTARAYDAYALADQLRNQGVCVVLGGLHVSALPQEASAHADVIVVGQGETMWQELLRDFENNELKPCYGPHPLHKDRFRLEDSKTPRYDLIDFTQYNRVTLQTSRGCPHHCTFCAASRTISSYQLKPIDKVRTELETIFSYWSRPFIELADDNTFVNKAWSKELLKLFCQYPMKWFTETDISVADDPERLELLALSNCAQVLIGFESAIPNSLVGIDAHDWKRRQFDKYLQKIEIIQSYGISVNGCFILGLDSDDKSIFETTKQYVVASALSEVQITILTPFPGTDLYRQLHQSGRLLQEKFWDQCTLFDVTYVPKQMSPKELKDGFHGLMKDIYADEAVRVRKSHFRECRKERKRTVQQGR
jgi:radical SAM superfamily enzyme YgiQ (UPF0313 family)